MSEQAERSKTIVVVDDDLLIRNAVSEILRDEGYTVISAGNGQEAFELLAQASAPHLILLDLMMPGMDGWQFRAQQRLDQKLAEVPVVVLSAGRNDHGIKVLEAAAHIRKPFHLEEILAIVAQHVNPK